jgi:hypothetical protein
MLWAGTGDHDLLRTGDEVEQTISSLFSHGGVLAGSHISSAIASNGTHGGAYKRLRPAASAAFVCISSAILRVFALLQHSHGYAPFAIAVVEKVVVTKLRRAAPAASAEHT